jgi:hypothetical protein
MDRPINEEDRDENTQTYGKERNIYVKTIENDEERKDTAIPFLANRRRNSEPIWDYFSNEAGPLFEYSINSC